LQKLHLPHEELNFFQATTREEHWFIRLLSHTLVLCLPVMAESEAL
jgi:hypothetical protein